MGRKSCLSVICMIGPRLGLTPFILVPLTSYDTTCRGGSLSLSNSVSPLIKQNPKATQNGPRIKLFSVRIVGKTIWMEGYTEKERRDGGK